jgi:6-pyruvoyltetrahydropterin/6-carboxytetrahydropterin synthase
MNLMVEIEFNAAHRIMNHPAECRYIHGHRYKVIAEVIGELNEDTQMVHDFRLIKKILIDKIHDIYDHSLILKIDDELLPAIIQILPQQRLVLLENHPTCESIARDIFLRLNNELNLKSITVFETPTMSARITREEEINID